MRGSGCSTCIVLDIFGQRQSRAEVGDIPYSLRQLARRRVAPDGPLCIRQTRLIPDRRRQIAVIAQQVMLCLTHSIRVGPSTVVIGKRAPFRLVRNELVLQHQTARCTDLAAGLVVVDDFSAATTIGALCVGNHQLANPWRDFVFGTLCCGFFGWTRSCGFLVGSCRGVWSRIAEWLSRGFALHIPFTVMSPGEPSPNLIGKKFMVLRIDGVSHSNHWTMVVNVSERTP